MNHALILRNDDYEVTVTLKDPRMAGDGSLTHWARLVEAVMTVIQTGEVVVPEDSLDDIPERWRTLRFRPERHGEHTVASDQEARYLSTIFDGIDVHQGDRLTWGLGIEGDC